MHIGIYDRAGLRIVAVHETLQGVADAINRAAAIYAAATLDDDYTEDDLARARLDDCLDPAHMLAASTFVEVDDSAVAVMYSDEGNYELRSGIHDVAVRID